MPVTYTAHGAAREVTGSKHLFDVNGKRILVDCGIFQGRRLESYQRNQTLPFRGRDIDDVILTHAHFDHCGSLPTLVKDGYTGNIYSTPATRDIANLVLMDAAFIQQKDLEYLKKKYPDEKALEPLYDQRDVLAATEQFVTVNYERQLRLSGGVTAEFLEAGHILGSAMVLLTIPRNDGPPLKVLAGGDLGRSGMPIIRDPAPIPHDIDYILLESTYGARLHDPIGDAMDKLADIVNATHKRGGKLIIPAFAVERTQEIIFFLHQLHDAGRIPEQDIFVDSPMAVNATSIYRIHPECYNENVHTAFLDHHKNPFGMEKVHYVMDAWESRQINDRKEPCIIMAGSGMCEGGRILHHLKNHASNPANTILVVGFMAEHTLGRRIADRDPEIKVFGKSYPLRATVKILNTFSAHADYEDMRRYMKNVDRKKLKGIFLVHGEDEGMLHLKQVLEEDGFRNIQVPEAGRSFTL